MQEPNDPTQNFEVGCKFWIKGSNDFTMGPGDVKLIKSLIEFKNLTKAASVCHYSYKYAWKKLKNISENTGKAIVNSHRGGKGGGGSHDREIIPAVGRVRQLDADGYQVGMISIILLLVGTLHCVNLLEDQLSLACLGLGRSCHETRNGQSSQDADNDHDNHELDQCETLVAFVKLLKHG